MKRIITLFLSLLLLACLPLSVFATENDTVLTVGSSNAAYVVDDADLLSASEASELSSIAEEISRRQQCDVVILTVDSLGGKSATAYADDYFDYNGYGYGADRSGILFLLSMEERDWWMSTRGSAIQAFTDDGIQYLFSKCKSNISNSAGNTCCHSKEDVRYIFRITRDASESYETECACNAECACEGVDGKEDNTHDSREHSHCHNVAL